MTPAGAEPFSSPGGPGGALVLHGFTGSPQSMRSLAEALAAAGLAVELPRLPGHGTRVEDMVATGWPDWSAAAERAYSELAGRCSSVVAVGLSMGGTLACWLAARHPELAGLAVINPLVEAPAESFCDAMRQLLDAGETLAPGIGSDIAAPGVEELAYSSTPIAAALSLFEATAALEGDLQLIRCPVLLLSSRQDHVVPPSSGDLLVDRVEGPVERVWLEQSYHVATLDLDRAEVESRTAGFALKAVTPAT